jgi:hypothetical protein
MTGVALGAPAAAVMPQVATPCLAKLDARPWHTTLAVQTGDFVTGVRVNTAEVAARLEAWLEPVRVPGFDSVVSPNFSVELGDRAPGRRQLHLVYRDSEIVARRRDADDLLLDLTFLLDEAARLSILDRLVVHASGVVDVSGVVLVPAQMHTALLMRRPQLEDAGLHVLPHRTQVIDPVTSEVELDRVDARLQGIGGQMGQLTGRHRLRTWCLYTPADQASDLPRSAGIYAACPTVLNRYSMGVGSVLRSLRTLTERSRMVALPELSPSALSRELIALAESVGASS